MALGKPTLLRRISRFSIRNTEVATLLDVFLVCAVGTILVIRFQLWLTNYPQLGGGKLHIAHMLWGGLLMMIAIIIMFSFLTRWSRRVGTVLGGIGFGFFIDELGKFITKDNDYFFKPTTALIYIIFIVVYLVTRALLRERTFTPTEKLVNAIEILKKAGIHDLREDDKRRALKYLGEADQSDPLVGPLRRVIEQAEALPPLGESRPERIASSLQNAYFRLVRTAWFGKALRVSFVVAGLLALIQAVGFGLALGADVLGIADWALFSEKQSKFIQLSEFTASLVVGALALMGAVQLRRSRLAAYLWFDRALLVNIFLVQVFRFLENEMTAIFGLFVSLLLLVAVRYMISREELAERAEKTGAPLTPAAATG